VAASTVLIIVVVVVDYKVHSSAIEGGLAKLVVRRVRHGWSHRIGIQVFIGWQGMV
jgi:hypothetical protein